MLDRAPAARPDPAVLMRNAAFKDLVRERTRFAWTLSAVIVVIYLAFIGLVAFDKDLMATKVGGGTTSLGILLGLAVIVVSVVLTGIYVQRANTRFDDLTRAIKKSVRL